MTRPHALVAALACLTTLTACVSKPAHRGIVLAPETEQGLAIVSFTQPLFWFHVDWGLRTVGIPAAGTSELRVSRVGPLVIVDGELILFPIELPAGEYELFSWKQAVTSSGTYHRSIQRFSVRFRVFPGKATYVGNLRLATEVPVVGRLGSFRLSVRDLRNSDIPRFLRHYPNVKAAQIQVALMEFGDKVAHVEPVAWEPPEEDGAESEEPGSDAESDEPESEEPEEDSSQDASLSDTVDDPAPAASGP